MAAGFQLVKTYASGPAPQERHTRQPRAATVRSGRQGDEVQEGQALATVEAMKMENILRAERRGVVKSVKAEAGQSLRVDDVILEFE